MIEDVIAEVVKKRQQEQEEIIKQAFEIHFGFPFDCVSDKDKLDRVVKLGSSVQAFRYRGEVFLFWDESEDLNVEAGVNYWRGTLTAKYLFV